jgi:DNA-binding MarR family transcriptional regulator
VLLDLLGYNLAMASVSTTRVFRKHVAPLGLSQVEFTVLTLLANNADVTQSQLGRALGAAPSNLANLLVRMETKALIQRSRGAPDARIVTVALTQKGATLAKKAVQMARGMEDGLLGHLSEGERRLLFELLQKVARQRHG